MFSIVIVLTITIGSFIKGSIKTDMHITKKSMYKGKVKAVKY